MKSILSGLLLAATVLAEVKVHVFRDSNCGVGADPPMAVRIPEVTNNAGILAELPSIRAPGGTYRFGSIYLEDRDLRDWYVIVFDRRNFGGWPTGEDDLVAKNVDSKHTCLTVGGLMKSIRIVKQTTTFVPKVPVGDTCCRIWTETGLKGESKEFCVNEGDFEYIVPDIPTG